MNYQILLTWNVTINNMEKFGLVSKDQSVKTRKVKTFLEK